MVKHRALLVFLALAYPLFSIGAPIKGIALVDWSRDGYRQTPPILERISGLNANAVSINFVLYQKNKTSTVISRSHTHTPSDTAIREAVRNAHESEMKVLLRPYVDAEDFTWRAVFAPSDKAAWFESYGSHLLHYARLAEEMNVELFSVGIEFKSLSREDSRGNWIQLIQRIREAYAGSLVYSANWDNLRGISFWDQVDILGVDAYFPLSNEENPTLQALIAGWTDYTNYYTYNWVQTITDFQKQHEKPVLFTEIGYSSARGAAREPWRFDLTAADMELQKRCYEATFQVWNRPRDWFLGMFWWAVWLDPRHGGPDDSGYSPMNKPAENTIRTFFSPL